MEKALPISSADSSFNNLTCCEKTVGKRIFRIHTIEILILENTQLPQEVRIKAEHIILF